MQCEYSVPTRVRTRRQYFSPDTPAGAGAGAINNLKSQSALSRIILEPLLVRSNIRTLPHSKQSGRTPVSMAQNGHTWRPRGGGRRGSRAPGLASLSASHASAPSALSGSGCAGTAPPCTRMRDGTLVHQHVHPVHAARASATPATPNTVVLVFIARSGYHNAPNYGYLGSARHAF